MNFTVPTDYWMKVKEGEIPGPCQRAKRPVEHESDCDTNRSQVLRTAPKEPGKKTG